MDIEITPGTDPQPAFPDRAGNRIERSDREILIDIQERLVRMETIFTHGGEAMRLLEESVRREGLLGIAKVIPEMMRLAAQIKQGNPDGQ